MKKVMILIVVAALVGGGIFLVRQKKQRISQAPVQPARTMVRTETARTGDLAISRTYLARVEPWRSVSLNARITSRVTAVSVREGDQVAKGRVLAVLDDEELAARVRAGEAAVVRSRLQAQALSATVAAQEKRVHFLERELARDELLVREGALARVAAEASDDRLSEARGHLEAVRKSVQAAREEVTVRVRDLEQARTMSAYARITAPFDGVVARCPVDPGDLAGPSRTMLILEDHSRFKVRFDVPQAEMADLRPGMEVQGGPGSGPLAVSRILPSLNPDRTVTVECDTVGNGHLRAGSTREVKVVLTSLEDEVLLPEDSLVPAPGGGDVVFAVEDGVTVVQPVTVLGTTGGLVAVRGVAAGAEVVRSTYLGWNRLAAGEPVEVLP